jgi:chromosome partitioning protein
MSKFKIVVSTTTHWNSRCKSTTMDLSIHLQAQDLEKNIQVEVQEVRPIYYCGNVLLDFRILTKCIAFHSYKGGTGKTTLAANFAASLAKKGYKVFLLDLDVYAPSLQSYFEIDPEKWINDFLFEKAELKEVVLDLTPLIEGGGSSGRSSDGQLWVAFCNAKKEEIFKIEGASSGTTRNLFRRFILLRELLTHQYKADYIIIDTSPGIRFWSINALVIADILLLILKMTDLDIVGTRALVTEIYDSLTKFGAISFLLLNRVSGYCLPYMMQNTTAIGTSLRGPALETRSSLAIGQQLTETQMRNFLTNETGMKVLSAMPCYCDIQFSRKEFLTVLNQPEHFFASQFEQLVHAVETSI